MVEPNGRHGLKCKSARAWKVRHDEVNLLNKQGLDQGKLPSTLEPIGLSRKSDGRMRSCKNKKNNTSYIFLPAPIKVKYIFSEFCLLPLHDLSW